MTPDRASLPRTALAHVRHQWAGFLALFLVLAGGTAYAANQVSSKDIVNGQVKTADLAGGAVKAKKLAGGAVRTAKIADGAVDSGKIKDGTVASADVLDNGLTGADLANHTLGQVDIDGTDHSGALGVGGLSNGRCTTVSVAIGGARAGDAGILTTDGTLPDGEVMYLQRVLADTGHVKVCNLSGGDLPAVTVNVRILTFH